MWRLLVQNLQSQGFTEVFLDSEVVGQIPKTYFEANGYRYQRDTLDIRASIGHPRPLHSLTSSPDLRGFQNLGGLRILR
ncbi:hypothetical protein C8B47_11930 [filamentous cyanobacterium CCP4]|nr:hypothetical protein C8B47_11930 [filamentous cyanobacterium CCP4]